MEGNGSGNTSCFQSFFLERAEFTSHQIHTIWTSRLETTVIRGIAVLETSVSQHNRGPDKAPLKHPIHHSTIVLRSLRGVLNWTTILCRETLVSQTANVSFFSLAHWFVCFVSLRLTYPARLRCAISSTSSVSATLDTLLLLVWLCPTHPTPGIEPGARMRCAINVMISVSATL